MTRLGFLHTAESNAVLVDSADSLHLVRPDLLASARAGVAVDALVVAALTELRDAGATQILCTCSTLGAAAERAGEHLGLPVTRTDRALADLAVAAGRRIAVLTAVESTRAGSLALVQAAADAAGRDVEIIDVPVVGAWALFEAGEIRGYLETVARAAKEVESDVILLAQLSMTGAADLLVDHPAAVVAGPGPAVTAALELEGSRA